MLDLSPSFFYELSHAVKHLQLFPLFDGAHYVLMSLAVRDDLAAGSLHFSRKHPLSCWLSTMLMCFAGSIVANLLLGESLLDCFNSQENVILASTIWYLIFYSPFDICYRLVQTTPLKLLLTVAKEIQRTNKVHAGVVQAIKIYPDSYLIMVVIGTVKGAGAGLMRTFEQFVRGVWSPSSNEILRPSFPTKACILGSVFFVLEKKTDLLNAPHDLIYFLVVCYFVYFKLSSIIFYIRDPFLPFENLFCAIFMGGIWDALSRALTATREKRSGKADQSNSSAVRGEPKKEQ